MKGRSLGVILAAGFVVFSGMAVPPAGSNADRVLVRLKEVADSPNYYWAWTHPWVNVWKRAGDTRFAVKTESGFAPKPTADVTLSCEYSKYADGKRCAIGYSDLCAVVGTWWGNRYYAANRATLTAAIKRHWHEMGGITVFSWHMDHPYCTNGFEKAAYRFKSSGADRNVIRQILDGTGGPCGMDSVEGKNYRPPFPNPRAWYMAALKGIADFFNGLVDEETGEKIPVIMRYGHEMEGTWFWWGRTWCTSEEFRAFCRMTADYLRAACGDKQILFAYTPDRTWQDFGKEGDSENTYLAYYPGDKYVDIVGLDDYSIARGCDSNAKAEESLNETVRKLRLISSFAKERGKVAALTETGVANPTATGGKRNDFWVYLHRIMTAEGVHCAFVDTWGGRCGTIPETPESEKDELAFSRRPEVLMAAPGTGFRQPAQPVAANANGGAGATITGCPDFDIDLPRDTGGPVVRATDFGFTQDDDNNAAAITRALEHCRKVGASKLLLAPGKYYFRAEAGVMMKGLKDLTIEGEGAILIFDRPSVYRDAEYWRVEISPNYGNFRIRDCERVRLRNFSIDWDWERDPLASFVRVTKTHVDNVATNTSYFEVEFLDYDRHPSYPRLFSLQTMAEMDENRREFADSGACKYYGSEEGLISTKFEWLAPNRIRLWPWVATDENTPMCAWRRSQYSLTNPSQNRAYVRMLKEGRLYRLGHYYVGKNCFDMVSNRHLTFEDINIYSCRGDAFHVEGKQEYWQYIRVKVRPPEDVSKAGGGPKLRPMTTTLDVMHIGRSCGHLKLIGFECTLNQDDHANFHDRFSAVRKTGPRSAEITQERGNAYFQAEVGSPLEFRNSDLSPAGFTAVVTRVVDDMHLEFDRDLPDRFAESEAFVFDRAYGTDNVLVKDCVYESCWGRFLLLSHNATVENCVWRHGIASGVLVQQGFKYGRWAEGFGSGNVVIRNCTFDALQRFNRPARPDGLVCDLFVGVNLDTSGMKTSRLGEVWPQLIDGVLIENNTFIDPRGAVLHVANGTNIVFRGNRIVMTEKGNPHPLPYAGEVVVDPVAQGVEIEPPLKVSARQNQ